jgi:hypothetical protein
MLLKLANTKYKDTKQTTTVSKTMSDRTQQREGGFIFTTGI